MMHLIGVLLTLFLCKAPAALPLAGHSLLKARDSAGASTSADSSSNQEPGLFQTPGKLMRLAEAYDADLLLNDHQLSKGELYGAPYRTYRRETSRNLKEAKATKLQPRNETPWNDEDLETLRHEFHSYWYGYLGSKNAEKRKIINAKDDSDPEKQRYKHLKSSYNRYRKITGIGNKHGPAKPRPDLAQYTPEDVDALHKKHKEYFKRYYKSEEGRAERARLQSRQGTAKELEEFDDLQTSFNEYARWREWVQAKTAGDYTNEERAVLKANLEGYRIWRREFKGPENRERRAKLESGVGSPEEISRYKKARDGFRAYTSVTRRHRRNYGKLEIGFDESERGEVQELEALRAARNTFVRKYGGPDKAKIRAKLEAGIGPAQEVKEYEHLHRAFKDYQRIYGRTRSKILKRPVGSDQGEDTSAESEQQKIIGGTGRSRWFEPVYKKTKRVKKDKGKSDGTTDKAVLEPSGVSNSIGIPGLRDFSSGQQPTGAFDTHFSTDASQKPKVLPFPKFDVEKTGIAIGTAISNAAGTVLRAMAKPSREVKKGPGLLEGTHSLPARIPLIP